MKEREAELARSNRELQDFASVASHDLREPLRKIEAFGDQLRRKYGPQLDETGRFTSSGWRRRQSACGP
jgi:light-regulated signal transduction histidine kinase (bacteriophytochrome)